MIHERYLSSRIQTLKARVSLLEPVLSQKKEELLEVRSQLKLILKYGPISEFSSGKTATLDARKRELRSDIGRLKKEIREAKTEVRIYEKETDPNVDDGPYVPDERL